MTMFPKHKDKGQDFSKKDGRTKQADSIGCDINVLMKRYNQTGDARILNVGNAMPQYGDFSQTPDFMQAQLQIKQAQQLFMELPCQIRERFENEPNELIAFMNELNREEVDESVVDEALELGLVERPQGWRPSASATPQDPPTGETDTEVEPSTTEGE